MQLVEQEFIEKFQGMWTQRKSLSEVIQATSKWLQHEILLEEQAFAQLQDTHSLEDVQQALQQHLLSEYLEYKPMKCD